MRKINCKFVVLINLMKFLEDEMITEIKDNILYFDGCNTIELAKKYGTPLYVYSENAIMKECDEIKECFLDEYENTRAAYATKAFSSIAICKLMDREGFCMDV